MKNKLLLALALAFCAPIHAWSDSIDDFKTFVTPGGVKPFALDLGAVLGGAAFHSARALGLPGFDVGVVGSVQFKPDPDNTILRSAGVDAFGIPMVQAEVGLPLKIDAVVHGSSAMGVKVIGGGLRYGLHKAAELSPLPDVSISAFGDSVRHDYFKAAHYSLNAVASLGLPIFKPYLGVGWDHTTLEVRQAALASVVGAKETARGTRFTGGVDISPLPFFHIYGAYSLRNGNSGADFGLGARF